MKSQRLALSIWLRRQVLVDFHGQPILDLVFRLNRTGKHVIFGCNHIDPRVMLFRFFEAFDDLPVILSTLGYYGIGAVPVVTVDPNISTKRVAGRWCYRFIRAVKTRLILSAIDQALVVRMNLAEPSLTARGNIRHLRLALSTLVDSNVTFFPYGNSYPPGRQRFDIATALPNGNFLKFSQQDVSMLLQWRNSIKPGMFWCAQKTGLPIVPVYIEFFEDSKAWLLMVGEPLYCKQHKSPQGEKMERIRLARSFVDNLRNLRLRSKLMQE